MAVPFVPALPCPVARSRSFRVCPFVIQGLSLCPCCSGSVPFYDSNPPSLAPPHRPPGHKQVLCRPFMGEPPPPPLGTLASSPARLKKANPIASPSLLPHAHLRSQRHCLHPPPPTARALPSAVHVRVHRPCLSVFVRDSPCLSVSPPPFPPANALFIGIFASFSAPFHPPKLFSKYFHFHY
jgi:hypothetical protein